MELKSGVLIGVEGLYKGFEFDITKTLLFGRDAEKCNILYPKTANGVSKVHLEVGVCEESEEIYVVDRFSTFGTKVNEEKIEKDCILYLKDGDVLMFGENQVFRVKYQ